MKWKAGLPSAKPVEASFSRNLDRDDAALIIQRSSKVGALGLFTGQKGRGIAILDVDANLSALRKRWGDSLDGAPCITSTRKNAAKFVFRVPEELWGEVSGWMHSQQHQDGYEVLWGRQGLIAGEYPGSKDGKSPEGQYTCTGDFNAVPEAPAWLLAEMKAAKVPSGVIKNKTALDLSDRTEDEVATIINECLEVITGQGAAPVTTGSGLAWQSTANCLTIEGWSSGPSGHAKIPSLLMSGRLAIPASRPGSHSVPGRLDLAL